MARFGQVRGPLPQGTSRRRLTRLSHRNNTEWDQAMSCFRVTRVVSPGEELLRPYNIYGILSGLALDILGGNLSNAEMPNITLEERRRAWAALTSLLCKFGIEMWTERD